MYREEVKEQLTSDTATLTESLYAIVDMIFDKGVVTKTDLCLAMDVDIPEANEAYVWTIEDVKYTFNCSDDQANDVIEKLQNDDWCNEQVFYAIDSIGDYLKLKRND